MWLWSYSVSENSRAVRNGNWLHVRIRRHSMVSRPGDCAYIYISSIPRLSIYGLSGVSLPRCSPVNRSFLAATIIISYRSSSRYWARRHWTTSIPSQREDHGTVFGRYPSRSANPLHSCFPTPLHWRSTDTGRDDHFLELKNHRCTFQSVLDIRFEETTNSRGGICAYIRFDYCISSRSVAA